MTNKEGLNLLLLNYKIIFGNVMILRIINIIIFSNTKTAIFSLLNMLFYQKVLLMHRLLMNLSVQI